MTRFLRGARPESASFQPRRAYAYYVLAVLCLANVMASVDRFSFFILIEPIKHEFRATDTTIGLVSGMAFILFYVLLGIPVARWVDRGNRKNILAGSIAIWSFVTMLGGAAGGMVQLGLSRAGLGAGEAAATPASNSLIGDYFPTVDRPAAVSAFQAGMAISAIGGAPLIGIVAHAYGWRMALVAMGAPGLLVAMLIFLTVREPRRGVLDNSDADWPRLSVWRTLRQLFANPAYAFLVISQIGAGTAAGILPIWLPIYLMRAFSLSLPAMGAITGYLNGAVMLVTFAVIAALSSALIRRPRGERWIPLVPTISCALAVPLFFATMWATSLTVIVALATGYYFCQFASRPAAFSLSIELVPADQRGLSTAVIVIANSVIGAGIGPFVVGMISDRLAPTLGDAAALRTALLTIVPAAMALCAVGFAGVTRNTDSARHGASRMR